jgi:hypothetical protein
VINSYTKKSPGGGVFIYVPPGEDLTKTFQEALNFILDKKPAATAAVRRTPSMHDDDVEPSKGTIDYRTTACTLVILALMYICTCSRAQHYDGGARDDGFSTSGSDHVR